MEEYSPCPSPHRSKLQPNKSSEMVNREPRRNEERLPYGTPPCLNFVVHPFHGIRVLDYYIFIRKVRDIVLGKLRYTNRGRRAWYPLRGWWYRSSPDRNIVPRQRLSPSARKSSGSRSPDTGWSGSRHLAKDKPCCPCTCNRQSANDYYSRREKEGKGMNLESRFSWKNIKV